MVEHRARRRRRAAGHFMVGQAQVDQSVVRHQVPQLAQGPQGIRQLLKEGDKGQQLILANADLLPRRGRELGRSPTGFPDFPAPGTQVRPKAGRGQTQGQGPPRPGGQAPLLQVGRQVRAGLRMLPGVQGWSGQAVRMSRSGEPAGAPGTGPPAAVPARVGEGGADRAPRLQGRPGRVTGEKGFQGIRTPQPVKTKTGGLATGLHEVLTFCPGPFLVGRLCEDDKNINI